VKPSDTCWSIAASAGITLTTLLGSNPTINPSCTNLLSGFYYYVFSTGDWNATAIDNGTSTTVAPPAPTPPGTTGACFAWHVIVSRDTCSGLEQQFGVTLAQLQAWNPQLSSTCTNLLLEEAYCVAGPSTSSTTTSVIASSTTVAPPAPTHSGTTGACFQWHVIVSGDFCALIEQNFGITMAQLKTWNPQLADDCSNLLLGEAYCVKA
jgi:LysM repeat protein